MRKLLLILLLLFPVHGAWAETILICTTFDQLINVTINIDKQTCNGWPGTLEVYDDQYKIKCVKPPQGTIETERFNGKVGELLNIIDTYYINRYNGNYNSTMESMYKGALMSDPLTTSGKCSEKKKF